MTSSETREVSRAWYRKKRVLLPAAAVALCILIAGVVAISTIPGHLAAATLTGTLPDRSVLVEIREGLLSQPRFRSLLKRHENAAVARYGGSGDAAYQKRYIYRTPLSFFDVPGGAHDHWAVRIRTDIDDGTARTSFLVRPGVVYDPEAAAYFKRQCGGEICRSLLEVIIGVGNAAFRYDLFSGFRLNVTEMSATSSIKREAISTGEWAQKTERLHEQGQGPSFGG